MHPSVLTKILTRSEQDAKQAGEMWAIALSNNGQFLAATAFDGRINVWDCLGEGKKIREYETKGSFGLCIDLVCDVPLTAVEEDTDMRVVRGRTIHC